MKSAVQPVHSAMEPTSAQSKFAQRFDPRILASLEGLDFKARYVMEGFLNGVHDSPFHGFSVEFSDYRNYQPGDDLRHLDWRLYARSDRLCVKRYMQETNVRFYLLCDTSASMSYRGSRAWASKLEAAQILGAALTWFLLRQNDAAGMIALEGPDATPQFIRPSQRPSQFGLILRELGQLQAGGAARLSQLLAHAVRLIHRRSVILFFTDLLESAADLAHGLKQLRFLGHECLIFQVLDPDEIDFPFRDPRVFQDLESGSRRMVAPATARHRYLERFNAFMAQHHEAFQQLEMTHCLVRTDEDPSRALATFLARRKRLQ